MKKSLQGPVLMGVAAAGTLLLFGGYETWQKLAHAPTAQSVSISRATPMSPAPARQPSKPADAGTPAEATAAARTVLGPDGVVLAYADFQSAGGKQILAAQRLPGSPAPNSSDANGETTAEVIRVSILVSDAGTWKEAFHADEHLKNRRGYLLGTPSDPVSAWHLAYSKSADSGFRLQFTPAALPPGKKPVTVSVGWNAKRGEYDSVKASGKGFLEPTITPGNAAIAIKP